MNTETLETQVLADPDVCCPEFDPALWDHKKHVWSNKLFLKDSVPEIFHIPLPTTFSKAVTRMWQKASDAGATPEAKDMLMLVHDPTPFKGELLMAITKEIPGADLVKLSGTYMSRVFDGPYSQAPKYLKEMNGYLASHKLRAKKFYFYYAYCPECSKKYGHNYIVVVAEV